jgi:hypothetical protein
MLLKIFWVARCQFLVYDTTFWDHFFVPSSGSLGQTSDPKTLVIHQKLMPGNNPKNVKQHIVGCLFFGPLF